MHQGGTIHALGVVEPQREWLARQSGRDEKQDAMTKRQAPPFQSGAPNVLEVAALIDRTTEAIPTDRALPVNGQGDFLPSVCCWNITVVRQVLDALADNTALAGTSQDDVRPRSSSRSACWLAEDTASPRSLPRLWPAQVH
jgi:hypothetical protein